MTTPFLTSAEMDAIGAEFAIARADTCVIKRPTGGRDAGGAPTTAGSTVATVACRVDPHRRLPLERIFGGHLGAESQHVIAFPRGTDVANDDQITVNGTTVYDVIEVERISFAFELNVTCHLAT
jgi:hypothetical protein